MVRLVRVAQLCRGSCLRSMEHRSLSPTFSSSYAAIARSLYHELVYSKDPKQRKKEDHWINALQYQRVDHDQDASFLQNPPLDDVNDSSTTWIKVQMHMAPWNPADTNAVQLRYPSPTHKWSHLQRSKLAPTNNWVVAGSEGLGSIVEVRGSGDSVKNQRHDWKEGDMVVLALPGLGSCRSQIWLPERALLPLGSRCIEGEASKEQVGQWSTLLQLGGTAWKLLTEYAPRDDHMATGNATTTLSQDPLPRVVIQNAARSNVGFMVQQLLPRAVDSSDNCKDTVLINVVRGPLSTTTTTTTATTSDQQTKSHVNIWITEDELQNAGSSRDMWHVIQQRYGEAVGTNTTLDLPRPSLALDAVGGDSGSRLVSLLVEHGVLVNYGALSQQPLCVSPPHLIFQDKQIRGHWHSRSLERASWEDTRVWWEQLVQWVDQGILELPPVQVVPLHDYKSALDATPDNGDEDEDEDESRRNSPWQWPSRRKVVLDLDENIS